MARRRIAPIAASAVLVLSLSAARAQMPNDPAGGTMPAGAPATSGLKPARPAAGPNNPALPLPSGGTTRDITAPGNGGVAGTGLGGSVGRTTGTGSGSTVKGPPGQGIGGQGGGGLGQTGGPTAGQGGVAGGSAPSGDKGVAGAPLDK